MCPVSHPLPPKVSPPIPSLSLSHDIVLVVINLDLSAKAITAIHVFPSCPVTPPPQLELHFRVFAKEYPRFPACWDSGFMMASCL